MGIQSVAEAIYATTSPTSEPATSLKYMTIIFPLITAIITFILTSLFTMYKDRKSTNINKRIFIEYAEFLIEYPFNEKSLTLHGKGLILLGENGTKMLKVLKKIGEEAKSSYMVVKNITNNDVINVLIKTVYSSGTVRVTEEFNLPLWKHSDSLYLPQTIYESENIYSQNDELSITYTTSNFEVFRYRFLMQEDGKLVETLKKRYLGLIWITKVKYHKTNFYKFIKVGYKGGDQS